METNRLVIVGAGGFGREILDVLDASAIIGGHGMQANEVEFLGFLDDGEPDEDRLLSISAPFLGTTAVLQDLAVQYLIGVGNGVTRKLIDQRATDAEREAATVVHRTSAIGRRVHLSPGAVICAQSTITTNVQIGRHFHLNLGATVGHDCVIGDYVTVSPGVNISGNVSIGDEVLIGTNAAILPGVKIGDRVTVGAGALVTRDVESDSTVVGAPARVIRR